ncbi:hypothetical protein [Mycolicibacterium fortuitum]|nr:hypothetical protein [Mycolicibacterium fortuitum]AJR30133.1 hypothetical protein G155_00164 [Mycobacterium sp. VKM Ac-1817D]CRL55822.1 hypothetical protein CPGR_03130 [Mycolicibacterium fortuitum subsp. fortuitum DSM 46621 = ATCC 6841 = JCM 6387]
MTVAILGHGASLTGGTDTSRANSAMQQYQLGLHSVGDASQDR